MIPAICLVYSGATARLSSLLLFRLPFLAAITSAFLVSNNGPRRVSPKDVHSRRTYANVISKWYLWGYSLTFSDGGAAASTWGADRGSIFLRNVMVRPVGEVGGAKIPEMVYMFFQGGFAAFT
jgi:Amt family ammonium transporter